MEMSFGMDPLLEWKFEDAQTLTESQPKGCHLLIRGHSFQNNCGGVQFWVGKLDFNFIGEEEEIHPPKQDKLGISKKLVGNKAKTDPYSNTNMF